MTVALVRTSKTMLQQQQNAYRDSNISNQHVDGVRCSYNDCLSFHKKGICSLSNEICNSVGRRDEEVLYGLENIHINLHFHIVEEVCLLSRQTKTKIDGLDSPTYNIGEDIAFLDYLGMGQRGGEGGETQKEKSSSKQEIMAGGENLNHGGWD